MEIDDMPSLIQNDCPAYDNCPAYDCPAHDIYDDCSASYDRLVIQKNCLKKENCSICLDSLYKKTIMHLPCKHNFHYSCLIQSIENDLYTCPLCRYNLTNALLKIGYKYVVNEPHIYNHIFDIVDDHDDDDEIITHEFLIHYYISDFDFISM
jgi:hypothetical protein